MTTMQISRIAAGLGALLFSMFRLAGRAVPHGGRVPRRRAGTLAMLALAGWPALAGAVLPIEHWTTKAGARVYFVHAPSIPMFDVSVTFDAGGRFGPAGKEGLATLLPQPLDKAPAKPAAGTRH